jgi:hypothetical protein
MGCNAWNHDIDCPCDFRGGHGYGRGRGGPRRFVTDSGEPTSYGWSSDRAVGIVASYVNPNAHCPVCGEAVFFYPSPHNGRVFFDDLGPPWPKHPCTDNGREPRRATRTSISPDRPRKPEPQWRQEGWEPLLSAKVYKRNDRILLTGDMRSKFTELWLLDAGAFDREGPVLARACEDAPGFFEIAVLQSSHFDIRPQHRRAHDARLAHLGPNLLSRVAAEDAAALADLGRFMLYEDEGEDFASAVLYLERAFAGGATGVIIDLAVAALFAGFAGCNVRVSAK